jgi:hypothetical protein
MTEENKKDFAMMMRVTWQSYGRNPPDRETMKFWFEKLSDHSIQTVGNAFDKWINTSADDLPSFKNIADLCKPNPTIFARLPSPLALADNHRHAVEVKQAVEVMTSKTKDMKAWARKIVDGSFKSNAPDLAMKYAKEALHAS